MDKFKVEFLNTETLQHTKNANIFKGRRKTWDKEKKVWLNIWKLLHLKCVYWLRRLIVYIPTWIVISYRFNKPILSYIYKVSLFVLRYYITTQLVNFRQIQDTHLWGQAIIV